MPLSSHRILRCRLTLMTIWFGWLGHADYAILTLQHLQKDAKKAARIYYWRRSMACPKHVCVCCQLNDLDSMREMLVDTEDDVIWMTWPCSPCARANILDVDDLCHAYIPNSLFHEIILVLVMLLSWVYSISIVSILPIWAWSRFISVLWNAFALRYVTFPGICHEKGLRVTTEDDALRFPKAQNFLLLVSRILLVYYTFHPCNFVTLVYNYTP